MRNEWQVQQSIKEGRDNEAADLVHAVTQRVKANRQREAKIEATIIVAVAAILVASMAKFFI